VIVHKDVQNSELIKIYKDTFLQKLDYKNLETKEFKK